jgi:cytochrome c553
MVTTDLCPQVIDKRDRIRVARIEEERTLPGKQFGKLTALFLVSATSFFIFVVGVTGVASAEDSARGEQLFGMCAQCHMPDGRGNSKFLAPAIAGLPAWYVEGQLQKFKQGLRGLHADDTGGLRMYPMSRWLRTEADQKAVASYVASLPAPVLESELPSPGDAAKGAGYYAVCSACHGADGSGNEGMGAPPLTGQSDWYLLSSIQKYKTGARGSIAGDTLGPVMMGMVATLPNEAAILDVIAYIQTLNK